MARVGSGAVLILNGVDLSDYTKSVKAGGQADMLDCTPISATEARTYQKGLIDRSISSEGFFKHSASSVDDVNSLFNTALTNTDQDDLILFGEEGSALGAPAMFGQIESAKYDVGTVVGDLAMTQFEAKASTTATAETLLPGVFMMKATVTTGTNGSTYDNGASGTGYVAQFHNVDGDDACAFKTQHSTNGTVWADVSGGEVTLEVGEAAQIVDTSTSINRYRRVVATPEGTTNTVAVAMKHS